MSVLALALLASAFRLPVPEPSVPAIVAIVIVILIILLKVIVLFLPDEERKKTIKPTVFSLKKNKFSKKRQVFRHTC